MPISYAPLVGTTSTTSIVYFTGSTPTGYDIFSSGNNTIGFSCTNGLATTTNFSISLTYTQGSAFVAYTIGTVAASAPTNFNPALDYGTGINFSTIVQVTGSSSPGTIWTDISAIIGSGTSSFNVNIPAGYVMSMIFSKNGRVGANMTVSPLCFAPDTLVLMKDKTYKKIKDIKIFDKVISDIQTNEISTVSKVYSFYGNELDDVYKIPKGLVNNENDIIGLGCHPVWINGSKERALLQNIIGVEKVCIKEYFYNLQFDHEGTYYVEGIKVDSQSPYHKSAPLGKDNFIDPINYIPDRIVEDENDDFRNKPLLILNKVLPDELNAFNINDL